MTENLVSNFITQNRMSIDLNTLTLDAWLHRWLNYYSISIKDTTLNSYRAAVENHISRAIGNYLLKDIDAEIIQLFYNTLASGLELKKPLSAKTIRNVHGVLHKALEVAVKYGHLQKNPSELAILPRKETKLIKPLTNDEIALFLRHAAASKYKDVFWLALFTGLRQSEIIGLTWDCIDFENQYLIIDKQLISCNGKFQFSLCKNSKMRCIHPAEFVFDILRDIKEDQDADIFFYDNTFQGKNLFS